MIFFDEEVESDPASGADNRDGVLPGSAWRQLRRAVAVHSVVFTLLAGFTAAGIVLLAAAWVYGPTVAFWVLAVIAGAAGR